MFARSSSNGSSRSKERRSGSSTANELAFAQCATECSLDGGFDDRASFQILAFKPRSTRIYVAPWLVSGQVSGVQHVQSRCAKRGHGLNRYLGQAPIRAQLLSEVLLRNMDEVKSRTETVRQKDSRVGHQRLSVAKHAGVLQHGIHLRHLRASKVVGHQQIVDRQAAAENVAADDEIELPAEIDWTVGGVYDGTSLLGRRFLIRSRTSSKGGGSVMVRRNSS